MITREKMKVAGEMLLEVADFDMLRDGVPVLRVGW